MGSGGIWQAFRWAKRRARALAAAVALAGVAAGLPVATTALAGSLPTQNLGSVHGLAYRSGSAPGLSPGSLRHLTLVCRKPDWAPVGGGLFISGAASDARVVSDEPFDFFSDADTKPDDAWFTGGHNLTGSTKDQIIFAICRKAGTKGLTYVTKVKPIPVSDSAKATARCPAGSAVLGGGTDATNSTEGGIPYINTTRPIDGRDSDPRPDDGWQGIVYNPGAAGTLTVTAVCTSRGLAGLSYRKATAQDIPAGGTASPGARCPSDSSLTSGGISIQRPAVKDGWLNSGEPLDLGDSDSTPDDRYIAFGYNAAGGAKDMTAYAVCKA